MELKFRAWFKEKETYIKPMTLQEMIYQKNNEFSLNQLNDWFVFEQYTGLKDKNGKEIYVGDIVEYDFNNEVGVCKFDLYGVYFEQEDRDTFGTTEDMLKELRVIGNIHENKELLD